MMSNELLRETLANFVEIHDLVREHGGKWSRQHILPYLPVAAASGLLFGATNGTRMVGMAIIGPTNKPEGRDNFTPEGRLLFCYHWLIHPDYRKIGPMKQINAELRGQAEARYPDREKFCYQHYDRYVERKIREGEDACAWEAAEPTTSAEDETERLTSSNGATRGPSRASRLLPSSTSS